MRWSTWTWVVGLVLWASGANAQLSPLEQVRDVRFHAGVAGTATGNTFAVSGWTSIGIQVTGITTATVDFRATIDGTNYVAFPCVNASGSVVSSTTANGLFTCAIGQFKKVRAPISSHSSGTVVVTGVLSTAVARGSGGGGGSSLTVTENDASPSIIATEIRFTNGTVTDQGGGVASVTISGTGAPTDADYWIGTANGGLSAEKNLGALTTGLVLNTVSAGTGTPSAYAGTSCTNQVLRLLNASGAGTCITITSAYVDSSILTSGGALGTPSSGTATNLTGTAAGLTAGTATVANSGDSATSFFSSGTIEDARLPSSMASKSITGSLNIPNSTSLPGTCTVGDIYMDTDATSGQRLYACQSTNTWALQGDGGGGGGSVATDTIWDAAGDLAVGTGADTAAKLAKGTALQVLRVNAGATALEWADPTSSSGLTHPQVMARASIGF